MTAFDFCKCNQELPRGDVHYEYYDITLHGGIVQIAVEEHEVKKTPPISAYVWCGSGGETGVSGLHLASCKATCGHPDTPSRYHYGLARERLVRLHLSEFQDHGKSSIAGIELGVA